MTVWLRVSGHPAAAVDLAIVRWADGLARCEGSLWIGSADEHVPALRRELLFAGLGTVHDDRPHPAAGLAPAIGVTLDPGRAALDTISLRPIPLADATRGALGRRLPRQLSAARRRARETACRDLLRGLDATAWWERRAWLAADALRHREVRRRFRPIVFDRAALDAPRPGGVVRAADGALTRWAFA